MADDLEEEVTRRLRKLIDPELGLNVVDLGLIYGVELDGRAGELRIDMTLTTRGCPLEGFMVEGARNALSDIPGIGRVDVRLVWDPPWTPDRINAAGQGQLNFRQIS